MTFHENHLLADDSHEKSYLKFFRKLGKMSQKLSSVAVVIGAIRVKNCGFCFSSYISSINGTTVLINTGVSAESDF